MQARLLLASVILIALLGVTRPAQASVNLAVGGDWIEGGIEDFNVTLGVDAYLARHFSIGGRAGVAFFDDAHHVGIPMDFRFRLHVQRVYFEGLVGPWLLMDWGDRLHVHGAFGFGLEAGFIAVGLEVGKLSDATMVGARLAFRL